MITKLTKKQEAQIPAYRDKWIEIGLRTGETDFETFDKYMPICYEKAGLKYPKNVVRVKSPLVGALAASVAKAIWKKKRDAVDGAVGGAVDGAVNTAISIAKKAGVTLSWHYWFGGQFWVGGWYWGVTFVNFFFDICKLKLSKDIMERALAYQKVCESVNYIWTNSNFVIVCERPIRIERNAEGRLHSNKNKAIEYSDGYGLYYIHGVKFTEEQFNKIKDASISEIISWKDIDQRSALLRERPVEELLKEVPKKLIDSTYECGGYKLYEIELPSIGKARIMTYKSWSSKKKYIKFVPPESSNCLETIASLRHQTVEQLLVSNKS